MSDALDWLKVLDAFEHRLAAQWEAFEGGRLQDFPSFDAPEPAGPLPRALQARATSLVRSSEALEAALAAALDATAAQLDGIAAEIASQSASEPVYFDSRV